MPGAPIRIACAPRTPVRRPGEMAVPSAFSQAPTPKDGWDGEAANLPLERPSRGRSPAGQRGARGIASITASSTD